MASYTTYYPIVGSRSVSTADGPFYYEPDGPDGPTYGYARGPWNKYFGQYSYGTWWKLYPHPMTDAYPSTQSHGYVIPATPTPYRWHLASWITPRLAAQTLGGTIDLIMGVSQSNADCLFSWRIIVWVSKGRYFLPERGLALDYTEPPGRPLPLVSTGWGLPSPQALASIAIEAGDYLTIEAGVIAYAAPGANRTHTMQYSPRTGPPPAGTVNPLLTVGSTATSDHAGHVLFSQPLALLDPPANDACSTPIVITTVPFKSPPVDPLIAELATYDPATDTLSSCGNFGGGEGVYNSVWWQLTAPSTGILRLEAARAGGDSTLVAYTGSCGAFTEVGCAVGYNGSVPLIKLAVTSGTTYTFRMGGRSHLAATSPQLQGRMVTVPSNDNLADRIVITSLPFTHATDLTLATKETGEPTSPTDWTSSPDQSVWYEWTADATPGHIRVDTMGSVAESQVTIWTRLPLSTFPMPPVTDLYDTFNRTDAPNMAHPSWSTATAWGGVSLVVQGQAAVSTQIAPLCAGNYWNQSRYGPNCEFWAYLRGDFPSTSDWVEMDLLTSSNPAAGSENGFWVGAYHDGAGYHAQLGRYNVGVSTLLGTATAAGAITGIGFRRLGSTVQLWVQRAGGSWSAEVTVTDAAFPTSTLACILGLCSAVPGNVAFETIGGGTLTSWLGDLWLEVFSAPWTNTPDEVGYVDQANCVFRPTPGVTYYITIFTSAGSYWNNYGGNLMEVTFSRVTPPPNETCATATTLTVPYYAQHDVTNAADGQMEIVPFLSECDYWTMEQDDSGKVLWFKWTADRAVQMNFNTFGSGWYGPHAEVIFYRGTCGMLEPLWCDSFNMRYEATQHFFTPEIGVTYYWRITSDGRMGGSHYIYFDVDHTTFQDGDVILSDNLVWIFAPSGAARRVGYLTPDIPTGSGIDPTTGLLYVAGWDTSTVVRLNARLETIGEFTTAPGVTPEVPGFFINGELYIGHWGNHTVNAGIDGLVHPSHAIVRVTADTGAFQFAYPAKQENTGTAWLDPANDQATIHYCSRGRKVMGYDVVANAQLPDLTTMPGSYPTYRARAVRHRPNDELLLGDAADVKRLSPTGVVLANYLIDDRDDLFVIDQDPMSETYWIGDQDTSEFYRVDIATGAVLLKVPGGHFGFPYWGAGYLCGLTVVGGYRAGVDVPVTEPACPVPPIEDAGPGGSCPNEMAPGD